jgi:hypothetical protein
MWVKKAPVKGWTLTPSAATHPPLRPAPPRARPAHRTGRPAPSKLGTAPTKPHSTTSHARHISLPDHPHTDVHHKRLTAATLDSIMTAAPSKASNGNGWPRADQLGPAARSFPLAQNGGRPGVTALIFKRSFAYLCPPEERWSWQGTD